MTTKLELFVGTTQPTQLVREIREKSVNLQEQSEVLCLGASIGVNGEEASGTLGAIVEDENSGTFYALSCDHVMKHPRLVESLNNAKYHLNK